MHACFLSSLRLTSAMTEVERRCRNVKRFFGAYLRAEDWGYRAGLADVVAGLACGRLVEVVVVMGRRAEKTSGHVGRTRGVSWRRRSRGATVSGGGRLVVHGREGLVVRGGQGEGGGAWGGGGGMAQVRLG